MAESDVRVHPDPPLRLFTSEEADALVPTLEAIFQRMAPKLLRLKEIRDLLEDQEAYWRSGLREPTEAERGPYATLLGELDEVRSSVQADVEEIRRLGGELKDADLGLVDFYAWVDGELAYLCWQRGEPRVRHWHTLEGGYAGRRPLPMGPRAQR